MSYIDCSIITDQINSETKRIVSRLSDKPDLLVMIPTGPFPSAHWYYEALNREGRSLGIEVGVRKFREDIDEKQLFGLIDNSANGVIILSEPPHLYGARNQLRGLGDEGYSVVNVEGDDHNDDVSGLFCTARACWEVINHFCADWTGYNAVIVGYGKRVGKPLAYLLMRKHIGTVTTTHIYTQNLGLHTTRADILISAVGKPNIITPNMVKPDSLVIDVGCSDDGKGDVHPDVAEYASVTPVPGGIGPITTALLLMNVAEVAKQHNKNSLDNR